MKASTLAIISLLALLIALRLSPLPYGVFIVPTRSMVPTIKPWDLVIVAGRDYKVGDIVVWCTGRLYCVVHRVVNITDGLIVTKGDANPFPDNPVPRSAVKGRVVLVIPRYAWVTPAVALAAAYLAPTLIRVFRAEDVSVIGLATGVFVFYIVLVVVVSLLNTSMSIVVLGYNRLPILYLKSIYFNNSDCSISIEYYGVRGLHLVKPLEVTVEGLPVSYRHSGDCIVAKAPPGLVAYYVQVKGARELKVSVEAELTRLGRLYGIYRVHVPYTPPRLEAVNGTLVIGNSNCYPLHMNVSLLYAFRVGEKWRTANRTVVVPPHSTLKLEPPRDAPFAYARVEYRVFNTTFTRLLRVRP